MAVIFARTPRVAVFLALVVAASLSACAPAPQPNPTRTPAFASEEEAFAAAEAVYRAYNASLNAVDTSNPETFERLYSLSSGGFEEADRENFSTMHAEGYVISGDAVVVSFTGEKADDARTNIEATVCLDVSAVSVLDAHGASMVNPARPSVYAIRVHFVDSSGSLTIDAAERVQDDSCAS